MSITERETKWKLRLPQDLWDAVPSPLSSAVGLREVCYTLPRAKVFNSPTAADPSASPNEGETLKVTATN